MALEIEGSNPSAHPKTEMDYLKEAEDRRLLLYQIEKEDERIREKGIVDRFMARDHVLHMRAFYNGDIDPEEVREDLVKVKQFIEDIRRL